MQRPSRQDAPNASSQTAGTAHKLHTDRSVENMLPLNEREIFTEFYRSSAPRLIAHLIYRGVPVDEAADCAHIALVKLMLNWRDVRSRYSWTRTTAVRVYLDRLRQAPLQILGISPELGESPIACADEIAEVVERHRIYQLVRQLPPQQRAVFALTLDGAAPQDIARELGATPEQVRSNLRLARQRMRIILESQDSGEGSNV